MNFIRKGLLMKEFRSFCIINFFLFCSCEHIKYSGDEGKGMEETGKGTEILCAWTVQEGDFNKQ